MAWMNSRVGRIPGGIAHSNRSPPAASHFTLRVDRGSTPAASDCCTLAPVAAGSSQTSCTWALCGTITPRWHLAGVLLWEQAPAEQLLTCRCCRLTPRPAPHREQTLLCPGIMA